MELKGRLGLIAEMVPDCNTVCDIGTDHAYIPIYLVKTNKCKRAVATDLRKGPLLKAMENIERYHVQAQVETRLGYGLEPIRDTGADAIILAGMGGLLICDILSKELDTAKQANCLILQPMNAIELVREWLYKNGFEIQDERLVDEGEKVYDVLSVRWTGEVKTQDPFYYHVGEKLIENRDPLLGKYVTKRLRQMEKIISGLRKSSKKSEELETYENLRRRYHEVLEGTL